MKKLIISICTIFMVSACCDSTPPPSFYFIITNNGKNLVSDNKQGIKIVSLEDKKESVVINDRFIFANDTLQVLAFNPTTASYLIVNSKYQRTDTLLFEVVSKKCQFTYTGYSMNGKKGVKTNSGAIAFEVK